MLLLLVLLVSVSDCECVAWYESCCVCCTVKGVEFVDLLFRDQSSTDVMNLYVKILSAISYEHKT